MYQTRNAIRAALVILATMASACAWAEEADSSLSLGDELEFFGLVATWLAGSAALGFVLNHFVLGRRLRGRWRMLGLAASRALFYAPSLIDVGMAFTYRIRCRWPSWSQAGSLGRNWM